MISGSKRFITNAPVAGLFLVFARTREKPRAPIPASPFFFLVLGFYVPGLEVGPHDRKMGQEGSWTADRHADRGAGARRRAFPIGGSEATG